jgi:peptidoglycan hydrolase-like protein with peptidoglycan-binding domain
MRVRKARQLALALLVAAGIGVTGASTVGQTAKNAKPKPSSTKHRSIAHHPRSYRRTSRRERGQRVPTPERIAEIQNALAKDGSFGGAPNGKWDAATVDAVKKFQDSHGLSPTGKLDAKTLQKLGLGSQTAGVAPPTPPVSSSSLTPGPSSAVPRFQ